MNPNGPNFMEAMENLALYGTIPRPRRPDQHEIAATWPCGRRERVRCDIPEGATTVFDLDVPEVCPKCGQRGRPDVRQYFISGGPR